MPRPNDMVKPGDVCRVAGWGQMSVDVTKRTSRLQEAKLIIQEDKECKKLFHHYSETTEICAGDPKKIQDIFQVGFKHFTDKTHGGRNLVAA